MNKTDSNEILSAINNLLLNQFNNFERKINKRFDKIEEEIKVIPQMQKDIKEIQEKIKVIPEMQEQIKEIQKQISVIPEMQKQIKAIPGMQSNIEGMQSNIDKMQNNIEIMQEDIKKLQDKYEELYTETRNISRAVARIEVEHGEKIAILLDAVTGNIEKQEKLENRLDKCESRIENNEHQIYFLNSKIQNL